MLTVALLLLFTVSHSQEWRYIEDGVAFTTVDENIWVFKIEQPFSIKVVHNGSNKILTKWAEESKATAAINLGMFHDGMRPSGYTRIDGIILQPKIAAYNTFIVWDKSEFKILDRTVHTMEEIMNWPNISQNIRMIKPGQDRNRWRELKKIWSVSTLAIDKAGNMLLIHSREAYNMRSFSDKLLASNLDIQYMVYLEGGPESSIVIRGSSDTPLLKYSRMGSYETDFNENDDNIFFWPLPFALIIYK